MKVGLYTDAHFSMNSSIILGSSNSLDGRLSYLVDSFKWMYEEFDKLGVEVVFDLGDLADSCNLRAEEITAITTALNYSKVPEYHILGNHERLDESGYINSINFINNFDNHTVVTEVTKIDELNMTLIPYKHYHDGDFDGFEADYALSHIDILGSDIGGWSLKSGLSPDYVMSKFNLLVNGHIHNGSWVIPKRIMNLGSISSQNFSNKTTNWHPSVAVLDTETGVIELIENPHALRFVNTHCDNLAKVVKTLSELNKNVTHAVQLKVPLAIVEEVREVIQGYPNVAASRVIAKVEHSDDNFTVEEVDKVNSLEGGFELLVKFINEQESPPYSKKDLLNLVSELEKDKEVV